MNPAVDPRVIAEAYEQDEAAAAAEYGAEFRRDIESFVSREAADACVIPGRRELPPVAGVRYFAFVDPSGGSHDSMTLAVAHRGSDGKAVLDSVYEVRPPFSPAEVVEEFAAALRRYGIDRVTGDRYAGEWPRERFREHGISFDTAEHPKSDLYRELLPLLNSGRVELLDNPRLLNQLCSLERRTSRGGRDSIDHPPNAHDDLINAAAGALVRAVDRSPGWTLLNEDAADTADGKPLHPFDQQLRQAFPSAFEEPDDLTCRQCVNRTAKDSRPWCKARRLFIEDRQPACDFFDSRPREETSSGPCAPDHPEASASADCCFQGVNQESKLKSPQRQPKAPPRKAECY